MIITVVFALLSGVAAWDVPASPASAATITSPFVSYASEFNFFNHYSGDDVSGPNTFSYNLLSNIGNISGTMPYWRVGGNSQDICLYNATQDVAIYDVYNAAHTTLLTCGIGPRFYQGFNQFPGVLFINGLNQAANGTAGREALLRQVDASCTIVEPENLQAFEYGNEADLYVHAGKRPPGYNETDYVAEWLNATEAINARLEQTCPGYPTTYVSPSFGLYGPPYSNLNAVTVAQDGTLDDGDVTEWSLHLYMQGALPPPTLQNTLMNHTNIVRVINTRTGLASQLKSIDPLPFAITEFNSILNIGIAGISDVFGAALWTLDFQLYAASTGVIDRMHVQQGGSFIYNSWQPDDQPGFPKATRPPYYGDITVASALGDATNHNIQIASFDIGGSPETDCGYVVYQDGALARIVAINLVEWNATQSGRPNETYTFTLPNTCSNATVARLIADGSDVTTGITFNGYSYSVELANGMPVKLDNATSDEPVAIEGGVLSVTVPHSSAAIVSLTC